MAIQIIKKIAVPILNLAARGGAAAGKAAAKKFAKPEKLIPKQKPTVSKSRPAKNQDPKTGPGAFSSGPHAIKPVMGQFKTALKKAGARQTNQAPFSSNSLARLSGKPKTGVLKQNIDNAIKQVRVKKSVKAKTGVRNEGRAVKNTRATKPSQRLKAMNARVSNSNKVAAAKTARGGTKLSKPTTKTRTATDNIKSADRRKGGGNRQPTSGVNAAQMRTATKALGARSGSSKTATESIVSRSSNTTNINKTAIKKAKSRTQVKMQKVNQVDRTKNTTEKLQSTAGRNKLRRDEHGRRLPANSVEKAASAARKKKASRGITIKKKR